MQNSFIKTLVRENLGVDPQSILETLMGEDYPSSWNIEEFKSLRSFAERKRYCDANLQRISSGSGRTVYKIDNEKVLKLAKNKKGVAQNEIEIELGDDYYFAAILGGVFESDENALWVEMELARKVTPTIFKKMVGVSIDNFKIYIYSRDRLEKGRPAWFTIHPIIKKQLDDSELVDSIFELVHGVDFAIGDLGRLSSWGLVNRGGEDRLVIIDYGVTNDVHATYYS